MVNNLKTLLIIFILTIFVKKVNTTCSAPSCLICAPPPSTTCTMCGLGYAFDPNGECVSTTPTCSTGCLTCTSSTVCTACDIDNGYYIVENACHTSSESVTGYYFDENQDDENKWQHCDPSCKHNSSIKLNKW